MREKLPDDISHELVLMAKIDQDMRNRSMQGEQWDSAVDAANTRRLKEIVQIHCWPTMSIAGVEGSQSAWLIAQHSDQDVAFQSMCLELMKIESPTELNPAHIAYLEDRVRVNQGKPQIYGTQFFGTGTELMPRPIEDQEHLDELRDSVGLGSFEDYRKQIIEIDKSSKH